MTTSRFRMRPYCVYQCLCSLGFLLVVAHTQDFQRLHWPEGRVVDVHPWLVGVAYGSVAAVLFFGLWGLTKESWARALDRWLPQAAFGLLMVMALMAIFLPGPYRP